MPIARSLCAALLVLTAAAAQQPADDATALPPRALRRYGTPLLRHGSRIQCLLFAPRGGTLIAGGGDDPVRLWDFETGQPQRERKDAWAQALAWNPQERQFAVGGDLRTLRLWNPYKTDEETRFDRVPAGLRALAYTADGQHVVAAAQDGRLLLFAPAAKQMTPAVAHQAEANAVACSPNGNTVVSGGADRTLRFWILDRFPSRLEPDGEIRVPGMVHALAFTPDGRLLLSAGDDHVIRVWDAKTRKAVRMLVGHADTVTALAIRADGQLLVSAGYDGAIRIWDLKTFREVRSIPRHAGDSDALALSPDGRLVATGGTNHTVRLFEVETGKERIVGAGPQAGLARCVLLPESGTLVALTQAGRLHTWQADSGRPLRDWTVSATSGTDQGLLLARHPATNVLVSAASADAALKLWDPAAGQLVGTVPLPANESLSALGFDPAGKILGLGFASGLVQLMDWPGRAVRGSFKSPAAVAALAFALEAPIVATASGGVVSLWDIPTGQEQRRVRTKLEGPEALAPPVADLVFSPDGRTLAIGCYDGVVRLVDWTTGTHLRTCEGHTSAAVQVAFSPDGRCLATAGHDRTVRLWETYLGKTAAVFTGHAGPVAGIAFATDGRTLYSASADTTMLAWDATGLSPAGRLPPTPADVAALQTAWQELASDDAARGQLAAWRLIAAGDECVAFLARQLYLVDPGRVEKLFGELNSDVFSTREKATQELEKYGRWMEGRIRETLSEPPTLEVRRRLERMLAILRTAGSATLLQERLRIHRVLSVLEQLGTPTARQVVEDLARARAERELQKEAEQSLRRWGRRQG